MKSAKREKILIKSRYDFPPIEIWAWRIDLSHYEITKKMYQRIPKEQGYSMQAKEHVLGTVIPVLIR